MKKVIISLGVILGFGISAFADYIVEGIDSDKLTKEERIQYCKQVGNSIVLNDESYEKYKKEGNVNFINLIEEVQTKQIEIFKKNNCLELLQQ